MKILHTIELPNVGSRGASISVARHRGGAETVALLVAGEHVPLGKRGARELYSALRELSNAGFLED